jgi:hypothetical protein
VKTAELLVLRLQAGLVSKPRDVRTTFIHEIGVNNVANHHIAFAASPLTTARSPGQEARHAWWTCAAKPTPCC